MTVTSRLQSKLALGVALGALLGASAAMAEPAVGASIKLPVENVYQIVFNPADGDVYAAAVGGRGEDAAPAAIIRLDGDTLEVVDTIATGEASVFGLGINTRTQTLYGGDTRSEVMAIVDLAGGDVVSFGGPEGAPGHLREVEIDEDDNLIYSGAMARGGEGSAIWVVDGATGALDRVIDVAIPNVTGLALDPEADRMFLSSLETGEVSVLDLASGEITASFPSGGDTPINVDYDPAGDRLFVANRISGDLTVLNAETGELLATVPTGEGALDVLYDPGTDRAYVTNRDAGTTTIVSGADYSVVANLETGTHPQTLAINPESGVVYVSNKALSLGRGAPRDAVPPEDPDGDTVVMITP